MERMASSLPGMGQSISDGVAVGVDERDDGDARALGLGDGDVLAPNVHDEQRAGDLGHLLDAADVAVELLDGRVELEGLFLGKAREASLGLALLQTNQIVDACLDGLEVGERCRPANAG